MFAQLGLNLYEFAFAILFTYSRRIFQHISQLRLVFLGFYKDFEPILYPYSLQ